jgi:hypothetical protein
MLIFFIYLLYIYIYFYHLIGVDEIAQFGC